MISVPQEFHHGLRFIARLPAFLKHPWSIEQAQASLQDRFERREERFLTMLKAGVFHNARSPYRPLMKHAGCEWGDISRMAAQDGVEGALKALLRAGVFISVDEFKGRRPVVRGTTAMDISPEMFRNPVSRFHVPMKSGGSRSRGTPVVFDLDFIRECALDTGLALQARGGDAWRKATWEVPGGGALFSLLEFSQFGAKPARWFSQLDPGRKGLHPRYRWSGRAFLWGAGLARVPMPAPEYVSLENPLPIVRWMAESVNAEQTPYLLTYPSSALRVCQAAERSGIDLSGAHFTIAGEPCTPIRLAAIRRSGASVLPKYGIMETGPVAYGCHNPAAPDDMHFLSDLHAAIQPDARDTEGQLLPHTVLFTSLAVSAPLVLLNVSMGDQAAFVRRTCDCPLEGLGWTVHIHSVRSQEKLTCGGMNFMDADVAAVLDDVLPARFGGNPTDYQILEEEGPDGSPVVKLLIHPKLGELDERGVVSEFLREVGRAGSAQAVMGRAWDEAGMVRVERRIPRTTPSGKILHLHVDRSERP
jgi:hypothetical protein